MYSKKQSLFIKSVLIIILFSVSSLVLATSLVTKVKDINAGYLGSNPKQFIDLNGTAIFLANSGGAYNDDGYALWRSDGTENGTTFIKDLDNPEANFTYEEFTVFNNQVFFRSPATEGYELWKTDGTALGTKMITDIYPGLDAANNNNSSYPEYLTPYDSDADKQDDILLFLAATEAYGKELWRTDGTAIGTTMIKDIHSDTQSINCTSMDGCLGYSYAISNGIYYFRAVADSYYINNNQDLIGGWELWRSDGTESGTYMVTDLTPYNNIPYGPANTMPDYLTDLNDTLIFSAYTAAEGTELYQSDGTAAGTTIIKDINPTGSSNPSYFTKVDNKIYFLADDGVNGNELWVSDGTTIGTYMVTDLVTGSGGIEIYKPNSVGGNGANSVIYNMTAFKGQLFFVYNDVQNSKGHELWKSDGTVAGTHIIKDIQPDAYISSYPAELTVVANKLFFAAKGPIYFDELWETDGTEQGTQIVADMGTHDNQYAGFPAKGFPHQLANINGTLFFSARTYRFQDYTDDAFELWKVIKPINLSPIHYLLLTGN